jgi:K+-transporting ATPase ATPase A chain
MAMVYEGKRHILSFLSPVERLIYRICGIDRREMGWKQYLAALLILNVLGFVTL